MKASVIISTYNAEEWLEKVLIGYSVQSEKDFELVIADDGSKEATRLLIDRYRELVSYPIVHVWQKDEGFQKSKILNKAILSANAEYLIFSDGDCIPRKDFVEVHVSRREPGYFLSGGYFMLTMHISKAITEDDIISQRCFDLKWLRQMGLERSFKNNKLNSSARKARLLNKITPTNASWNGHNASGWKKDLIEVNGFNHDMQYGGQDRELGERMQNLGIKSKQIRYSAICIHLDHPRGYKTKESIEKNEGIRRVTRKEKKIWTENGISTITAE